MAKRGRKPKETIVPVLTDERTKDKELITELKTEVYGNRKQLEALYKELALIKSNINESVLRLGFIDECETLAQASFKAGRAYGPLDEANDKLEEVLNDIYDNNDVENWRDLYNN